MTCPLTSGTFPNGVTMQFTWHPDDPPLSIEAHSKAKLSVLRSYLHAYFDRLNVNPARETFRIDLVDGFAGGGIFPRWWTVCYRGHP